MCHQYRCCCCQPSTELRLLQPAPRPTSRSSSARGGKKISADGKKMKNVRNFSALPSVQKKRKSRARRRHQAQGSSSLRRCCTRKEGRPRYLRSDEIFNWFSTHCWLLPLMAAGGAAGVVFTLCRVFLLLMVGKSLSLVGRKIFRFSSSVQPSKSLPERDEIWFGKFLFWMNKRERFHEWWTI